MEHSEHHIMQNEDGRGGTEGVPLQTGFPLASEKEKKAPKIGIHTIKSTKSHPHSKKQKKEALEKKRPL